MPYLLTTDATKKQSGYEFLPVTRSGSQLFGVLETDSATARAILATSNPFIKEIREKDYAIYMKRREAFLRAKNEFKMGDPMNALINRYNPTTPAQPAAKPQVSVDEVLKPRKLRK